MRPGLVSCAWPTQQKEVGSQVTGFDVCRSQVTGVASDPAPFCTVFPFVCLCLRMVSASSHACYASLKHSLLEASLAVAALSWTPGSRKSW